MIFMIKMKKALLIALLLIVNACISKQTVLRLIDQREQHFWYGEHQDTTYTLTITDNEGMWFNGHLIINDTDTLFLRGFEKGNNHPTHYKTSPNDSLEVGYIFLWARGTQADTVDMVNDSGDFRWLPREVLLVKREGKK
jgi:hypothetical protein